MKNILVATDFSPAGRDATAYAAALATLLGARLYLVHVFFEAAPLGAEPEVATLTTESMRVEKETRLAQEIEWIGSFASISVDAQVVSGFKGDSIRAIAEEQAADLIVLGRKNDPHRFMGSTITRLIRKSDKPVLIVPEGHRFSVPKHLVLAVDFSEMVTRTYLQPLLTLVRTLDASLQVVHVLESEVGIQPTEVSEKLQLERALSPFTYQYDEVTYADVDTGILHFVQDHPTDLLVMIAHHHTLFERLLGPLHTKTLSGQLPLPLLVLKTA